MPPAQMDAQQPDAPAPRTPRRTKVSLAVLLVALVTLSLPIGIEVVIHTTAPDAVRVTATNQMNGQLLASREITAPPTVADLYKRINSLPSTFGEGFSCPLSGPDVLQLTFRFSRQGIPLETAIHHGDGCEFWSLSSGGIQEMYPRWDPGTEWAAIIADIQLRCPGEWQQQCDGY